MARIPTSALRGQEVGSVQSQFTPTPFQNLNPDADVFGAGQARSLASASKGLDAFAAGVQKIAEDDDATTLLETQNNNTVESSRISAITADLRGKDAIGSAAAGLALWSEYEKLQPKPKTAAGQHAQAASNLQYKRQLTRAFTAREQAEVEAYKDTQITSSIGLQQKVVADSYNDPVASFAAESRAALAAGNLADRRGMSQEAREVFIAETVSKGRIDAIRMAVSKEDYTRAQTLLGEASADDALTPADTVVAESLVRDASVLGEGQAAADKIFNTPGLSDRQREQAARLISDPKIREKTLSLVITRNNRDEVYRKKAQQASFDRVAAGLRDGTIEKPTAADLEGLTARQRKYIDDLRIEMEKDKADPDRFRQPATNNDLFAEYLTARGNDPAYLTNITFSDLQIKYELGTTKAAWDTISGSWAQENQAAGRAALVAEAAVSKRALEQGTSATDEQLLKSTFTAVTEKQVDYNNGVDYLAWQMDFNRQVLEEATSTGKSVPPRRRLEIINNMGTGTITYNRSFTGDSSAPVLTLENITEMADDLADEDKIERKHEPLFVAAYPILLSAIRAQRLPVTRDRLTSTFNQMQSVALTLPEVQRAEFVDGYARITQSLLKQNSLLTAGNYRTRFRQALARQSQGRN